MFKLKGNNQTFGLAIVDCFRLLKHTWAPNIIIVLIGIIASLIVMWVFSYGAVKNLAQFTMMHRDQAETPAQLFQLMINTQGFVQSLVMFGIGIFLMSWVMKIINAILVRASWNYTQKSTTDLGNAFKVGLKYFWVYFLIMIVMIAITAAQFCIQWLVSFVHSYALDVLVAILTQLLVYYIAIKLILVETATVTEESGIRGFAQSWQATSNGWWNTLGVLAFANIFYVMVLYLVGLGIFWAVFTPGVNPPFSNVIDIHMPLWFNVIFYIVGIVTLLALVFTVPSMLASSQTVTYDYVKHREDKPSKESTTPVNPT